MIEDYHEIHMAHIYQEGNNMVDDLAKAGHGVTRLAKWDDINLLPSSTKIMMERECTFNNDT